MISVTFRGINYQIPEPSDAFTQGTTDYLNALSTGAVPFPASADVDLGASGFGLKAAYFKTRAANPAASGVVRLSLADLMAWRNNANNGDLALGIGAQNQLQFAGSDVTGNPMLDTTTAAGQSIPNSANTIVVFGTVVTDSDAAYNSGTGRYTVPAGKGGDYIISAAVAYSAAIGVNPNVAIWKNAAQFRAHASEANTPGAGVSLAVTAPTRLIAGDIIDIRTFQASGGAVTLAANAAQNFFSLKRIPA